MATFSKKFLSASYNGRPIQIGAIATPGTLIHTAVDGYESMDEVWIYAVNNSASDVTLTVEFGSVGESDKLTYSVLTDVGLALVIPGSIIRAGQPISAYAGVADVVNVIGWVNRITI